MGINRTDPWSDSTEETMRPLIVALALAGLGHGAAAQEFETPVQTDWGVLEIGLESTPGAVAEYRILIFEQDGKVAVCGAGIYANSSQSSGIRRTMRRAAVQMNGRAILRNLSFFPIHSRAAPLVGRTARCRVTGTPMDPGAEFGIDLPRRVRF